MRQGAVAAGATNLKFIYQIVTEGDVDDISYFLNGMNFIIYYCVLFNYLTLK